MACSRPWGCSRSLSGRSAGVRIRRCRCVTRRLWRPTETPAVPLPLIDTHCHLDVEEFDQDRAQVLAQARAAGLVGIVVPGIHAAGWPRLLDLCASA
ncbi:MAG TPA: TatD family hydrolase, partial [Chromatiaceae bacterium]|nr:TatD family hydrolase [Chromatiaceae bacterium]